MHLSATRQLTLGTLFPLGRPLLIVLVTGLQLRFDCDSTVLRPFDDISYDRMHCELSK